MAVTDLGTRLTEQHRQAQVANQQSFLSEFLALWGLLDVANLDRSTPNWLQQVLRLIELFRDQSAELTTDYYRRFREIEAPDADPLPDIVLPGPRQDPIRVDRRVARGNRGVTRTPADDLIRVDFDDEDRAARTSMTVTGPISIKVKLKRRAVPTVRPEDERLQQAAQRSTSDASRAALVEASGAGMRHVIAGSRKTALTVIQRDQVALGWARVTDGNPCAFCAMLSSRGPVYGSKQGASFEAHDHCACTAEAVFDRKSQWPGRAAEFRKLWRDNIEGQYSGKAAINAWRRLYERRQRELQREIEAA